MFLKGKSGFMTESNQIAEALERIQKITVRNMAQVLNTKDVLRADRELLLRTGWLQEIIKGWYMLVRPDVATGDTAAWYANFWDFIRVYLNARFSEEYCLSAESSLDVHTARSTVPQQLIAVVKRGAGMQSLMYETALLTYVDTKNFPLDFREKKLGLFVMQLPFALCRASPQYFKKNPKDAELALRSIKAAGELSKILIQFRLKVVGERLIGAYLHLKDEETAKALQQDLSIAGMSVQPNNPFALDKHPLLEKRVLVSPHADRIRAMWAAYREEVISVFPAPPGLTGGEDVNAYLQHLDALYQTDAYHSLSIEGYQVTKALIEKVKNNDWRPDQDVQDLSSRNALAAKGYFDAFQQVKQTVSNILLGKKAGEEVKQDLSAWYQYLFKPFVNVGILPPESLVGYRTNRVFIKNSRYTPPPTEAVIDTMSTLFDCLREEAHPAVRAILGHYFFVYIHPFMDGNGRIARFLMNTMLISGGYPWTVVRVNNRDQYIDALEYTHNNGDIKAFATFMAEAIDYSIR